MRPRCALLLTTVPRHDRAHALTDIVELSKTAIERTWPLAHRHAELRVAA